MQVVVLTNEVLKEELLNDTSSVTEEVIWTESIHQVLGYQNADVFIDLLFENEHTIILRNFSHPLIIINSVEITLKETNSSFVRINGWPGFLKSPAIEASCLNESNKQIAEKVFALFNKKLEWLPDEVGFVTPYPYQGLLPSSNSNLSKIAYPYLKISLMVTLVVANLFVR